MNLAAVYRIFLLLVLIGIPDAHANYHHNIYGAIQAGNNATLAADNALNLLAAKNTASQTSNGIQGSGLAIKHCARYSP